MNLLTQKYKAEGIKSLLRNNLRVIKMSFTERPRLYTVLILVSLLISILPFVRQGSYALLIDAITLGKGNIWTAFGLIALLLVLPECIFIIKGYLDRRYYVEMQTIVEAKYLTQKARIDIARYEDPTFNDLVNTANERGIFPILNMSEAFVQNIQNIVGVLVATTILLLYSWKLFIFIAIALIPKLYIEIRYGKEIWGIFSIGAQERRRYWDLRHHFHSVLRLTELKLFQNTRYFSKKIASILTDFTEQQKKSELLKLKLSITALVVSGGAYLFFGFTILQSAFAHSMSVGAAVFLMGAVIEFGNALSGFFLSIGKQYQDNLFVNDVFKVMDAEPIIQEIKNPIHLDKTNAPRIEFQNVSFKYPKEGLPLILENISFIIEPGEKLALVGINGAGKTTLIKLLCRFYDPTKGRILINGHDLKEVSLTDWWHMLGVLFQDFSSYNFLAKEVISLGRTDKQPYHEHIIDAAKMSESDEFINTWEKGYEQMLGKEFEGGVDPSKGQLQKLALARVFFRNPHVMVLDEPTASVDSGSEAKIFERFVSLPKTVSAILISHRFSTVRKADQIIVLKDKGIAEMGNHLTLMKKKGIYAELFRMQAEGYKE